MALCKRNLKIYFSNGITVFFSLLGALIIFGLYLLFLRKNMVAQFADLPKGPVIADFWVLGGILATTSLTTSFAALGQFVKDKAGNKWLDFMMTDKKASQLLLSYFLSGLMISFLMQLAVLIFCIAYFYLKEDISFTFAMGFKILGMMALSSFNATSINLIICALVKTESTLLTLNSILGAISGFMCTAYLPIGSFGGLTAKIIKLLPISYASSSFRRILVSPLLTNLPYREKVSVKEFLGIGYTCHSQLTTSLVDIGVLIITSVFCLFVLFIGSKKISQVSMA